MKKATLGAFAMVLVGTVTFSFTNALLADHSTKKTGQTHAPANFQGNKSVDSNNQSEQTKNDQNNSALDGKDVQTLASLTTSSANQSEIVKSEQPKEVNQQNTTKISSPATSSNTTSTISTMTKANTTSSGTTSTKTTASSAPATNLNSAPTVTTSTIPVSAPAQTNSTTTTPTNHGQQISQAAKQKAASQQNKKGTN